MQKKKSLGQHFLHSASYLNAVADAAGIQQGETVLEVGPGEGTLTEVLLARGAKVIAVEKDARLIAPLRKKFAGKEFEVIEGDALDLKIENLNIENYKLVGNIPYYISGALFKKFLTTEHQPSTLVFLVQKEVAERIARSKKESILSLSVKAYGTPKYIKTVPAGAFSPPPKVDSAILLVSDISRGNFKNAAHEARFFALIKKAFGQKRKMLRTTIGIDSSERPEDLPLSKWLDLSRVSVS